MRSRTGDQALEHVVATEHEKAGYAKARSVPPGSPEEFARALRQRRQAAQGLEQDLLTNVPLLYGSPGSMEPHGDPGVVLAKLHQEELIRRNGGGVLQPSRRRPDAALPFEHATGALAVLLFLLFLFAS
jgi:hypothetical protein